MAPRAPSSRDHKALSTLYGGIAAYEKIPSSPSTPINTKTNMSSLRPPLFSDPPRMYPTGLLPPSNLPINLDSQKNSLADLDVTYNAKEHPILNSRFAESGLGEEGKDEMKTAEALKVLEQHIIDRMPYAKLANHRLQAVMGTRNERVFDLPGMQSRREADRVEGDTYGLTQRENAFSRSLRKKLFPDENSALGNDDSFGGPLGAPPAELSINGNSDGPNGLDTGLGAKATARGNGTPQRKRRGSEVFARFSPTSPLGSQIDKKTGVGLREFLLSKGKETGTMRKTECKSITFCDFMPDLRSGDHRNVLLAHYSVEKGERIDVYEVDLPTTTRNPETGEEFPTTETWIWFLLSRPVVSLNEFDTSTRLRGESPILASGSTKFYTPNAYNPPSSPTPGVRPPGSPNHTVPQGPPNLPHPIPTSWVVFACPLSHITTYPDHIDTTQSNDTSSTSQPNFPFHHTKDGKDKRAKKIHKRKDYDFSHYGIPIFEFSGGDVFSGAAERLEFLSVEGIGGWDERDEYMPYTDEEYTEVMKEREESFALAGNGTLINDLCGLRGQDEADELPSSNKGLWWKRFYERIYADVRRWKKVRSAMGRGKCRVVVRWVEREAQPEGEFDMILEGEEGVGLGMGVGLGIGMGSGGGVNIVKGTMGKRKLRPKERLVMDKQARVTRSETRKQSALGLEIMSAAGGGGGIKENVNAAVEKGDLKLKGRKR